MKGLIRRGWRSFNFVAVLPSLLSLKSNTWNAQGLPGFWECFSDHAIFQYHFPLWLLEAIRQSSFSVNVSVRAHLIWEYWEDRPLKPGSCPWCQIRWPCQKASWCWSYSAQIMSFTNYWFWWDTVIISLIVVPRTQSCGGRSRWFGCGSLDSLKVRNLPWSLCLSAICLWHWLLILWCQWQGPRWDCFLVPLDWIHSDLWTDW